MVSVVGGEADEGAGKSPGRTRKQLPASSHARGFRKALPHAAKTSRAGKVAKSSDDREVRPEQVIPLDEDDFKEF
jgi:hypothetical protein